MAINKTPPQSASNNAQRGLELREKYNRGGLSSSEAREQGLRSGVDSAKKIASGDALSDDLIKAMARFNRFRGDYKPDERESDGGQTAGTIAWLLWGGTAGVDWALKKSKEIDEAEKSDDQKSTEEPKDVKKPSLNTDKKQYKSFSFETKNINEDERYYKFEGYASTFGNVDLGDDIIERGAFTTSLKNTPEVPVLWQHDMEVPIGKSVEMREDENGLFVSAILPKKDTFVSGRVMPQMEVGSIKEMSIGFMINDADIQKMGDKYVRVIKDIDLFEFSLVTKAMNPQALVTGFKSVQPSKDMQLASRDRDWDSSAAVQRIRSFTNSEDAPSADYKQYFMYYDAQDAENFTAYKLPFADIINGEPRIVPKAIFAIAAALGGARGGVDIPEADRAKIENIVNACYDRMAKEFNDDSLTSPLKKSSNQDIEIKSVQDISCMKDIENILKVKCEFSQSERKLFISKIKDFSKQRDVVDEVKGLRDAIQGQELAQTLNNFINELKGK